MIKEGRRKESRREERSRSRKRDRIVEGVKRKGWRGGRLEIKAERLIDVQEEGEERWGIAGGCGGMERVRWEEEEEGNLH